MTKEPVMVLCALVAATDAARIPPLPRASSFSARVDNVRFPLRPSSRYIYTGVKDDKRWLYLRGRLEERTTDWYSQDAKGNVWYFGESTAELDAHGP